MLTVLAHLNSCEFFVGSAFGPELGTYMCCNILCVHIFLLLLVSSNASCHHRAPCDGTEFMLHMNIMSYPTAEQPCLVMIRTVHTHTTLGVLKHVHVMCGIHKLSVPV